MALILKPYIPDFITVHMGSPTSNAENVTVRFIDYIKNVASSEIYPTWDEDALRANILAQISYALNRVYTEYYPSRGYPFQITSTTAVDQKFIKGRSFFEPIERIVDDIFDSYLRRIGNIEPLAAKFCNGTTSTCDGLSQWGSEDLAQQGYDSMGILNFYYGDNIERVDNAPIQSIQYSYPGYPLRQGTRGPEIVLLQSSLNRISQDYPAIPKIWPLDGVFGPNTYNAVKKFQEVFNLTSDGVVGKATWYKAVSLFVAVTRLSELVAEGQQLFSISYQEPDNLTLGDDSDQVMALQYGLSILAEFNNAIPFVTVDGIFGLGTQRAVLAYQGQVGLPETGRVSQPTWDALLRDLEGAGTTVLDRPELFPTFSSPTTNYANTPRLGQYPGYELSLGSRDKGRVI